MYLHPREKVGSLLRSLYDMERSLAPNAITLIEAVRSTCTPSLQTSLLKALLKASVLKDK